MGWFTKKKTEEKVKRNDRLVRDTKSIEVPNYRITIFTKSGNVYYVFRASEYSYDYCYVNLITGEQSDIHDSNARWDRFYNKLRLNKPGRTSIFSQSDGETFVHIDADDKAYLLRLEDIDRIEMEKCGTTTIEVFYTRLEKMEET